MIEPGAFSFGWICRQRRERLHGADPDKDLAEENKWEKRVQIEYGKELDVQNEAKQMGMNFSIAKVTLKGLRAPSIGDNWSEPIRLHESMSQGHVIHRHSSYK